MDIILDKIFLLHSEDSKTNVCVPFLLTRDYHSLEIFCSYEPKHCEDKERAKQLIQNGLLEYVPGEYRGQIESWENFLPSVVNLITFSLDSSGQYLGCAHRHAKTQRHVISADFSSPGFIRYSPLAGEWRAVINVHAVVSSEVRYCLKISAHEKETQEGEYLQDD